MQVMHSNNSLMVACRTGANWYVSRLVEVPGLDINYQDGNGQIAVETHSDNLFNLLFLIRNPVNVKKSQGISKRVSY